MIGRGTRIALEVIAGVTVGLVVLFGAATFRLTQGPVSLAFLKPYVIETIGGDTALGIDFDDLVLAWAGWERNLDVRAIGVRVRTSEGSSTATIPEMSISFSLPALADGRLAPTSLDFIRPRLRIVRDGDGSIRLGLGEEGSSKGEAMPLLGERFLAMSDDGATAELRRISVIEGQVTIQDRKLNLTWHAPRANLILNRTAAGLDLRYSLDIAVDGQTTKVAGAANFAPGQPTVRLTATIDGLDVQAIARSPGFELLSGWNVRLNATIAALVTPEGEVRNARMDIKSGPGTIVLPAPVAERLQVRSIEAKGNYEEARRAIQVEALKFDLDGPVIAMSGTVVPAGRSVALDWNINVQGLPPAQVWRLWPKDASASTRRWVTTNIEGGIISEANAHVFARLEGPADRAPKIETATGTLRVRGGDVHFLRPLPPATKVDATLAFSPSRVDVWIQRGELARLQVPEGTLAFTNLDRDDPTLDLEVVINGPLSDALTVLDHPRFGYVKRFGISPREVGGVMATRLLVQLPLVDSLPLDRVSMRAASNLRDVAMPGLVFGQPVTAGNLILKLDKTAMTVSGQAKALGADVDMTWTEDFTGRAQFRRTVEARGTLDAGALKTIGWDLGSAVRGPLDLDLTYSAPDLDRFDLVVRAKLDRATIAVPQIEWTKEAGRPGEASIDLSRRGDRGWTIRRFDVRSGASVARGSAAFGRGDNSLERLEIEELVVPPRTRLSASVRRADDNVLDVALKGAGYDAEPMLREIDDDARPGPRLPPVRMRFDIDSLWFGGEAPMRRAVGSFAFDGASWRTADLSGRVGSGEAFALNLSRPEGGPVVTVRSDDAGATLSGLGIVDDVKGGKLEFVASKRDGAAAGPWQGRLDVHNFQLEKAPGLTRLLTLASLTGISDVLAGNGIRFARLELPFVHENRRINFKDARAVGSELGITASGHVDLRTRELDVRGTLVPAYTLNSLLGNIPVIGQLFTGAKGSGVFAVSYAMTGPLRDPKATVNPVSALAPGFLRVLIDGIATPGAPGPGQDPMPPGSPVMP